MARTTPGTGIPVPESPDPRTITADLWASFSKVGQLITQTIGESSAALVTAEQAETAAAQALARALLIEDPIHVGPSEPTEGEELWVDTDDDSSGGPGGGAVSSQDITDATDVGRAVLTAPWSADARNALSIFTGTRALLDAGTDTSERTWDAKELHEYVTDTAAAAGGASSWDDLTDKPATYPPATHTHPITDVDGLQAIIDRLTYDSGWRDVSGLLPEGLSAANGRCHIKRKGDRLLIDIQATASQDGINTILLFPNSWRPDVPVLTPFTYWTATTANATLPSTSSRGYIGAGGTSIRTSSLPNPGTVLISLDLPISRDLPTSLPGDPA